MSCSTAPNIGTQPTELDRTSNYPSLVPLSALIAANPSIAMPSNQVGGVAALKARAKALRGPVIDPVSRQKLLASIQRHRAL